MNITIHNQAGQVRPEFVSDNTRYSAIKVSNLTPNEITALKTKLENAYNLTQPVKNQLVIYKNNKIYMLFPECYDDDTAKNLLYKLLCVCYNDYPHMFPTHYEFWDTPRGTKQRCGLLHAPKKSIY